MITNKNMSASDSDSAINDPEKEIKKHEKEISRKYEEIEDIKKKLNKKYKQKIF